MKDEFVAGDKLIDIAINRTTKEVIDPVKVCGRFYVGLPEQDWMGDDDKNRLIQQARDAASSRLQVLMKLKGSK